MSNGQGHYIAGWKTHADWEGLKARLLAGAPGAWHEAFADFYQTRLDLRYLDPIKVLQDNGSFQGEGFAIVAIQCSLIEFLESTEQGMNYRYARRGETFGPYEYKASQDMFVAFLKGRHRSPRLLMKRQHKIFILECGAGCSTRRALRTGGAFGQRVPRVWSPM